MKQRYDAEKGPDGLWMIIDRSTGLVVVDGGVMLNALHVEDVDDLLDVLNRRDIRDRKARGID
jgi:hypothetical protein